MGQARAIEVDSDHWLWDWRLSLEHRRAARNHEQTKEAPRKPSRTAPVAPGTGKRIRLQRALGVAAHGTAWACQWDSVGEKASGVLKEHYEAKPH